MWILNFERILFIFEIEYLWIQKLIKLVLNDLLAMRSMKLFIVKIGIGGQIVVKLKVHMFDMEQRYEIQHFNEQNSWNMYIYENELLVLGIVHLCDQM
jgi:hypothetical protein